MEGASSSRVVFDAVVEGVLQLLQVRPPPPPPPQPPASARCPLINRCRLVATLGNTAHAHLSPNSRESKPQMQYGQ